MDLCWHIVTDVPRSRRDLRLLSGLLLRWAVLATLPIACASQSPPSAPLFRQAEARNFIFSTPDGVPFSTADIRGRPSVLVFVTTYDPISQVVVERLKVVARTRHPRINVAVVVLEPPQNAVLAATYADALELPFPVVLADPATLHGGGPFGEIRQVPTFVVLDSEGREVYRGVGGEAIARLEAPLDQLQH